MNSIQMMPLPKGRITHSMKGAWLTCPEKCRRQYVLEAKQAPAIPLIKGSAVHAVTGNAMAEQLLGRPRPDLSVLRAKLPDVVKFEVERSEAETGMKVLWEEEEETLESLQGACDRALVAYEETIGHKLVPLESEKLFRIKRKSTVVGDYDISGKLDVYDSLQFVRDMKITGKKKDENEAMMSSQLTLYQMYIESTKRVVNGLALDVVVVTDSKAEVQTLEAPPRTEAEKTAMLAQTDDVVGAIRLRVFPKKLDWGCCSWCGYREFCVPDWAKMGKEKDAAAREARKIKAAEKEKEAAEKVAAKKIKDDAAAAKKAEKEEAKQAKAKN